LNALRRHEPALLEKVIELLNPYPGHVIVDCTVGGGGHALEILRRIQPNGKLVGIDQDRDALSIAAETLREFGSSVELVHDNFENVDVILDRLGIKNADGILFDLGLSLFQIDSKDRGFSFMTDSPLDMRMNSSENLTAAALVNRLPQPKLAAILSEYGQEPRAQRIARQIVSQRRKTPIRTTGDLVKAIEKATGPRTYFRRIHPATRTFQALRIAVNRELDVLETGVKKAIPLLAVSGRICVISFHSLEDAVVKNLFRKFAGDSVVEIITRKPIVPDRDEVRRNARCRSAKLRAARKVKL
jgi:16S rRNA (cytosine1402-N4)-methyltransferase